MFNLHNTIKVTHGYEMRIARNAVLDFKSFIYSNKPYGVYILAGGDTLYCEQAQLVSINSDVLKGQLYAEYSAQFQKSDYDGIEFSRCGLSGDGVSLCNAAQIEPIIKETGKSLFVSVTVYLTGAGGAELPLVGGDNPLARLLLGNGTLSKAGYACTDLNIDDNRFCGLTEDSQIKTCNLNFDNGIAFQVQTNELKNETVFTVDKQPVLKAFNIKKNSETAMFSAVPNGRNCIALDYPYVNHIVSASQGGMSVDFELVHSFDKVYKTDGIINFKAGAKARLESEPLGKFAAIRTDNEIHLYGVSASKPVKKMTVTAEDDEEFFVCTGGYLALFSTNKLKIYESSGALYGTYNVNRGEQNVLVFEGTVFHLCVLTGVSLKRYKITKSGISGLNGFILTDDTSIFQSWFRVGVTGTSHGYYFNTNTPLVSIDNVLLYLHSKYGEIYSAAFGRWAVCLDTKNMGKICVNLLTGEYRSMNGGSVLGAWGDLILTKENGETVLWHYNPIDGKGAKITGNGFDANNVLNACVLGGFLIVLQKNGEISAYYCNKKGGYVHSTMFNTTDTALITLNHKRIPPATKALNVTAKVTVS